MLIFPGQRESTLGRSIPINVNERCPAALGPAADTPGTAGRGSLGCLPANYLLSLALKHVFLVPLFELVTFDRILSLS